MNDKPILILMINHHLGNFVVSLPFIETIAASQGPADVVVDSRFVKLAQRLPSIRSVIPYEQHHRRQSKFKQATSFLRLMKTLWKNRYRAVYDVGGGIQSVTLSTLTFARIRVGLQKGRRNWLYSVRLPPTEGKHASDRFMPFMKYFGTPAKPYVRLKPSSEAIAKLDELLGDIKSQRLAVMHPGAGYEFRQWPGERFAAVADELARCGNLYTVFIGAPGEEKFLQSILDRMSFKNHARFLITDLDVILALMDRAIILVSNESGPTHLAAATDVPIVTIFGPSKEENWRPVREKNITILRGRICPPACRWGACKNNLECVMNVEINQVVNAAEAFLK